MNYVEHVHSIQDLCLVMGAHLALFTIEVWEAQRKRSLTESETEEVIKNVHQTITPSVVGYMRRNLTLEGITGAVDDETLRIPPDVDQRMLAQLRGLVVGPR